MGAMAPERFRRDGTRCRKFRKPSTRPSNSSRSSSEQKWTKLQSELHQLFPFFARLCCPALLRRTNQNLSQKSWQWVVSPSSVPRSGQNCPSRKGKNSEKQR